MMIIITIKVNKFFTTIILVHFLNKIVFDFVGSAWSFVFLSLPQRSMYPCHNGQWSPTSKDFHPWFFHSFCLTTGTIFIMSLVWHGLWLEIEYGSSCTRSHFICKGWVELTRHMDRRMDRWMDRHMDKRMDRLTNFVWGI